MNLMNLPYDVLDNIFITLLPMESLGRCKVVCKDWCSYIQSKRFIAKHTKNQRGNEKLLIYQDQNCKYVVSIYSEEEKQDDDEDGDIRTLLHQTKQHMPVQQLKNIGIFDEVAIIGTFNGIVCLDHTKGLRNYITYDKFTLWNPTTRDFNTLLPLQLQSPPGTRIYSDHVGFGFDCTTDDYKVIRILYFHKKESYWEQEEYIIKIKIYSLSTNSWREFDSCGFSAKIFDVGTHNGMLFGNKFCWLARKIGDIERDERFILSFDMGKEVFQNTPLPSESAQLFDQGYFTKLLHMHDSLALVLYVETDMGKTFEIWTTKDLEQGHSSWIKFTSVGSIPEIRGPIGIWKFRKNEGFLFVFSGYGAIKGIHINNQGHVKNNRPMTFKVANDRIDSLNQAFTYVETLVSVKKIIV